MTFPFSLRHVSLLTLAVLASGFFLLQGCSPAGQNIPEGVQTLSGALQPVDLSLVRRGTHVLLQDGKQIYYVESSVVNLRTYEGMDVLVKGTVEANSNESYLPVLVATEIKENVAPSRDEELYLLNLGLKVPLDWVAQEFDDGVSYSRTVAGPSVLKLYKSTMAYLPGGTPLVIGGERAVRLQKAGSGSVLLHVQHGKDFFTISYTPEEGMGDADLLRVLKSIVFTNKSSSSFSSASGSVVVPSGTGSQAGMPCGGEAGILCPAGSYCGITDTATGIGHCVLLKR